uniref:Cystatin domain-containing protein n=1 Tax=Globisporangium ultimum (strain ATCC 200006 / CBS 805.95 / DAOM BR144) TaxID=431595 RepID=K3X6G6_GLOUD
MFKNIVASTLLSLLLVCTVVSHQYLALTATEHNAVDTAWKRIEVTEDATTRLETALLNESQYREDVKERVCVEVVERLYELVVANDRKYQYYAYACQVESAAQSGSCTHSRETFYQCAMFDIRIYEQAWTRDVEVQSIEFSHGLSSPA